MTTTDSAASSSVSHLRADAQQNHDRLLEVAARAFIEHGEQASLKAIAREAGVGIGTLYRRFPSREVLVEAVYRTESARLCQSGYDLLETLSPIAALQAWMEQFLSYMAAKKGMAGALRVVLSADDELRLATRSMLIDVLAALLQAGERSGEVRPGLDPTDVVMALGGFALVGGEEDEPELAQRLLDLLLRGLLVPSR
jgi:AcrR family transcriptional regulator